MDTVHLRCAASILPVPGGLRMLDWMFRRQEIVGNVMDKKNPKTRQTTFKRSASLADAGRLA